MKLVEEFSRKLNDQRKTDLSEVPSDRQTSHGMSVRTGLDG
jgi:hypothetical protein